MKELFKLGEVVATPGAIELMKLTGATPGGLLSRHVSGDWGDLDEDDSKLNELAIANSEEPDRILSSYKFGDATFWVITEWDRSVTTILLPDEY